MEKRSRILVIDDDPLFRSLLVAMLRERYHVSTADDGLDAFYKAVEQTPDVAIIDIKMPVWDGVQTLKAFRAHPVLSVVKTVILTGEATQSEIREAMDEGADDCFIKSRFSTADFLSRIEELVSQPKPPRIDALRLKAARV